MSALAIEMEKTGYALLHGDNSMLLLSITAPNRGGEAKVVQGPPETSPRAIRMREEVRRVLLEEKVQRT